MEKCKIKKRGRVWLVCYKKDKFTCYTRAAADYYYNLFTKGA